MNKWFYDVFLASLFERASTNKSIWLTQKQTAICVENMEKHTIRQAQFQGDYTSHNYFTCEWRGRRVNLQYSKLNGCGTIEFSLNDEEISEAHAKIEAEKITIEQERIQRIKKNPERLQVHISRAQDTISKLENELKELYHELENPIDGISEQETLDDIEWVKEKLDIAKQNLSKWG